MLCESVHSQLAQGLEFFAGKEEEEKKNRFRSQQRLQSKLNQKSISQHNVYNFDLGVTELIAMWGLVTTNFLANMLTLFSSIGGHITPPT